MGLWQWIRDRFRGSPRRPARPLDAERSGLVAALDPRPFGVNSHTAAPEMMTTLINGGISWHRIDVDWDLIERERGQPDWRGLDATVAAAEGRCSLLASIAYTPAWATGSNPNAPRNSYRGRIPHDPAVFLAFVDRFLEHYAGTFAAASIWNEPNQEGFFQGTRQDYVAKLLRPGLEQLARRAPGIVRCGPDISSSPPKKPYDWLRDALRGAGDLIDVVTYHVYDPPSPPGRVQEVEKIRKLIADEGLGDRQLWITETGWRRGEVTPQTQENHLAAMMEATLARSAWWQKTFWFDSHGKDEGLLGPDGSPDWNQPFPVFHRYASIIRDARRA
jgi:hypothetical protein